MKYELLGDESKVVVQETKDETKDDEKRFGDRLVNLRRMTIVNVHFNGYDSWRCFKSY